MIERDEPRILESIRDERSLTDEITVKLIGKVEEFRKTYAHLYA